MIKKKWLDDAIIYHIFIDRFAGFNEHADSSQPQFCGGNIRGIIENLDSIHDLGANTIMISPFTDTTAYHGYHITNYRKIDEKFGVADDLTELIGKCKTRGIKIIGDIVPNHCSDQHAWFRSAISESKSKFRNWFYFKKWPTDYLTFMGYRDLPKINLENPETCSEMIDSFLYWANFGFDGFRIDHVIGVPEDFIIGLKEKIQKINPDFVLIGEAWGEGMKYKYLKTIRLKNKHEIWKNGFRQLDIQNAYEGILDGVFDFSWREFVLKNMALLQKNKEKFLNKLEGFDKNKTDNLSLVRFLDNHDTNRIMFICKNDRRIFRESLKLLFEQPTPVSIYYGTEYGMTQTESLSIKIPFSDIHARQCLIRNNRQAEYYSYIKDLSKRRKEGKL